MIDCERTIKGLGWISNEIVNGYITEPEQAVHYIADAITLLKEIGTKRPVCEKCGKQIDHVVIRMFNYDGSDSPCDAELIWDEDSKCAVFSTSRNWCEYELTDEERKEGIQCPECGKYPFDDNTEIEYNDPVEVMMWGSSKSEQEEKAAEWWRYVDGK